MPSSEVVDLYVPGARAWVPDAALGFARAVIVSKGPDGRLVLRREDRDETVTVVPDKDGRNLPPLQNPEILDGVDDLTTLSHLHEPAVLHNVLVRYARRTIYTYSGIVLVAFNPYTKLSIYGPDIMRTYANMQTGVLEPHLFAVAENAYRALAREARNQSVIVTGESGAGKTVSTKYMMRYFAAVDNAGTEMNEVEERVMATNPIMESFGNAKTIRNNNSSRFGKYIQILFNDDNRIASAAIRTYLLERSRVVYQAEDERNYHVFYQLIKGAPQAEREELYLSTQSEDYHYVNQGHNDVVDEVDDAADFAETQTALSKVGIAVTEQWRIFRLLAAILHLGNAAVRHNKRDESSDMDTRDDTPLAYAAELLQVDREQLARWIIKRNIVSRTETIVKARNGDDATAARDSISKFLYARLFDWLVAKVNVSLQHAGVKQRFIGLLDIYGFEIFKHNSFEQFCINYANEKLQQEFVQHVFKLEQELYAREEIKWSYIDYADNQPCIDLIEGRMGVYVLLDEECRVPKGTDTSFVQKLFDQLGAHTHLVRARFDKDAFVVRHYAQDVTYKADGFLDKNRDSITDEQLEVLQSSPDPLLGAILGKKAGTTTPKKAAREVTVVAAAAASKTTLGAQFKTSLVALMETIRSTSPHYIRCIKPNEQKAAFKHDPVQVLAQLRACGVLETIRISAAGYPSRHEFDEFAERYKVLVHSSKWPVPSRELCRQLLATALNGDEDKYQVGKTKIFLRAGQLALLERLRYNRLRACAIVMQKNLRRRVARRKYLALRRAAIVAQKLHRGRLARRLYRNKRRDRAIGIVRRYALSRLMRKRFVAVRASIVTVQAAVRAKAARQLCVRMKQRTSAIMLQAWWRMHLGVRWYRRALRLVVRVQSCVRRRLARLELRRLRMEARDLSKYKEVSYRLENKVVELTQQLSDASGRAERAERERTSVSDKLQALREKLRLEQEARVGEQAVRDAALREVMELRGCVRALQCEVDAQRQQREQATATAAEELARSRAETEAVRREAEAVRHELEQMRLANRELRSANGELDVKLAAAVQAITTKPKDPVARELVRDRLAEMDSPVPRPTADELEAAQMSREWVFVNETSKTVFSFEGDYEKELTQKLIVRLRPVSLNLDGRLNDYEVLFPAHVIVTVMVHMMSHNMVEKIQSLMINTFKSIHLVVARAEEPSVLAFWLANSNELRSLLGSIDSLLIDGNGVIESKRKDVKLHSLPPKVFTKLLNDSGYIVTEIYHCLLKKLRDALDKIIVPALLDYESSASKKTKASFTLWAAAASTVSPLTITAFLHDTAKLLAEYYVDEDIRKQVFSALLYQISARAFNALLLRKELCRPRRGVQIGLNVSQVQQWCLEHGYSEAAIHLHTIGQAVKLLQMPFNTVPDAEVALDACYLLNNAQIAKLLANFRTDDQDRGVPSDVLDFVQTISADAKQGSSELLMEMNAAHTRFLEPPLRPRHRLDRYIPSDLKLDFLSFL